MRNEWKQRWLMVAPLVLFGMLGSGCFGDEDNGDPSKTPYLSFVSSLNSALNAICTCSVQNGAHASMAECRIDLGAPDAAMTACGDGVAAAHPEANASFNCLATVYRSYAACRYIAGCTDLGGYTCANGSAIPTTWVCDGEADCPGGEDEAGCPGPFDCGGGGESIPRGWVCDGDLDCPNGSDEQQNCSANCEEAIEREAWACDSAYQDVLSEVEQTCG